VRVAAAVGVRSVERPRLASWPLLVVVASRSTLVLAFASRYGWQRDELYYRVAGQHLARGYVDFPPVTALLARLASTLFGTSLTGFRASCVLAGAGVVVMAAIVARDLGGGRAAQLAAAVGVGFSPILLGSNGLFQPVSFDQLVSFLLLLLALRLASRPSRRLWLSIGLVVGVGAETKYTLVVLATVLLASFALLRRDVFDRISLVCALGLAAALAVPNLVWEAEHGWISVHWFLHPGPSATSETRPQFLINMLLQTGLVAVPVAVLGAQSLWRDRRVRPLALTMVATVSVYFALNGKFYYSAPVALFAVAAGAVPLARWAAPGHGRWRSTAVAFTIATLIALPLAVPILPLRTAIDWGVIGGRSDYQDEIGWPGLASAVSKAAARAPVVVAANYGEAGALSLFGARLPPIVSGDMSFRYWHPPLTAISGIVIGYGPAQLAQLCRSYQTISRVAMPSGVSNEERGAIISHCSFNGGSLANIWPQLLYPRP
jgi:4-amino-4-deoxy-L-arabinose transferase-like glycosyltransferase